ALSSSHFYSLSLHDALPIYIPIARITDDFLGYIRQMSSLNIELASEFILVAATLMRIKARMLLPRYNTGSVETEIDSKEELVRRDRKSTRLNSSHDQISYAV